MEVEVWVGVKVIVGVNVRKGVKVGAAVSVGVGVDVPAGARAVVGELTGMEAVGRARVAAGEGAALQPLARRARKIANKQKRRILRI